ncbi:MAG: hypothetical protein LBS69_02810 [Prevotellaceae bacterium]|nr:hypothetical protein [Prevotellaceae bacterium]
MRKIIATFIFVMILTKIFAQTETQKLSLPDTIKSALNIKSISSHGENFNIRQNPFPAVLTIEHEDLYLSVKDLPELDSLNMSNMQKNHPDILFVRSAYFSQSSKLFALPKQNFGLLSDAELAEKLSLQIAKINREKYGVSEKPIKIPVLRFRIGSVSFGISFVGIGIGFLSREEYMKARAEKRKKAYVY